MSAGPNTGQPPPPEPEGRLKRFARWFEPYGILIAVLALVVAFATLWMEFDLRHRTLIVMEEERDLRKKTLAALQDDKALREASLLSMLLERIDVARAEKTPYAGHVPIFERLVHIGMDLRDIDATAVDFSVDDGMNLNDGDLSFVDFSGSDLAKVQLVRAKLVKTRFRRADLNDASVEYADLTQANLRQTNLRRASLVGANLDRTILKQTNVSGVDFKDVKGLRQKRLDAACADPEEPPVNLPKDSRTGNPLVWKEKACEEH